MSAHHERDHVKKAYPSKRWSQQVDKMSDAQVVAIYYKLMREGKVKS